MVTVRVIGLGVRIRVIGSYGFRVIRARVRGEGYRVIGLYGFRVIRDLLPPKLISKFLVPNCHHTMPCASTNTGREKT